MLRRFTSSAHHLHKHFLGILKSLEQTWIRDFQLLLIAALQGTCLNFFFRVDKSYYSRAACKYKFALIWKNHLNHFVVVAKQNSFLCALPFFDVGKVIHVVRTRRGILFCKVKCHWAELAVTLKIWLKMLQKNNFLINRRWVIIKVILVNLLHSICTFVTHTFNVNEMKEIRWGHNLCTIIKQYTKSTRRQLVAKTIFRTEVNKLHNKLTIRLLHTLSDQLLVRDEICHSALNLCKLLLTYGLCFSLYLIMSRLSLFLLRYLYIIGYLGLRCLFASECHS